MALKCQGCFQTQVFHFFNQEEALMIVQFVIIEWHLGGPTEEAIRLSWASVGSTLTSCRTCLMTGAS